MTIADQSISALLESLATPGQAPAGGTAAAATGALGASLAEMACASMLDRADDPDPLTDTHEALVELNTRLQTLADADAAIVSDVIKSGESAGAEEATRVPLEIAEAAALVVEHAATLAETSNGPVTVDATVGAMLAHAALESAVLIARHNVRDIEEPGVAESIQLRLDQLTETANARVARARTAVR